MDGQQIFLRYPPFPARGFLRVVIASLALVGQPIGAEVPEPFKVEGFAHPIAEVAATPIHKRSQARDTRGVIVRPRAHVLNVDRPAAMNAADSLLKPKPRLIVVHNAGTIRVAADRQVTSSVSLDPGTHPNEQGTPPNRPTHLTVEEALRTRGSVTFRKTPLSEVVFLLSDLWHINIAAGESVSGEVSGAFHDAPLSEVLSAALTAAGFSYRQTGNSLIVLPIDQVGADDPSFVSETIALPASLQVDESAMEAAELLLSKRGQLRKVGEAAVLVVDTAPRIARVRKLFEDLSPVGQSTSQSQVQTIRPALSQSGIAYFSPQYTEAEQMAEPLQAAMGESVIVAVYPEENRIMVKGNLDELRIASEAIQQLDKPRSQIRITAMIYDVGLNELERLGVNLTRDLRVNANATNEALSEFTSSVSEFFQFNADLTSSGAANIGISTLNDTLAASAFLEALDNTSEAKLLADPSITVGDRRQASIRIVRKIPIVGANPVENSNAVFTQVEFEEAGVILNVMPRISRDGTIELQVQPEYSVVAEITSTGPVIDSRTADTTVRVGDGQMFVLGGLRQKSIVESVRGIPYLKDIKHVGKLFRSHDTEVRESELIVFLRPEIITPFFPGDPRQQVAGRVAGQQLDAIPHAAPYPQTPCCKDPYCPHHHPRPRINGGSCSLDGSVPHPFSVEGGEVIVNEVVIEPDVSMQGEVAAGERNDLQSSNDAGDRPHPRVHVDPRVIKIIEAE